ncbi:MAG: signal peptidase I [Firmicutes bacterium]|nr:signal peptidase I [Bacillota bacterium]
MFFFKKKTEPKPRKKESIWSILGVIVLALLIKSTIVTIFIIPSESMVPTLKVGDILLVNRLRYGISNPLRELWYTPTMHFILPTPIPNPWFHSKSPLIKTRYLLKWGNKPKRLDIVIFKVPYSPQPSQIYNYQIDGRERTAFVTPNLQGMDYVKRLIGLPGDIVDLRNGMVYINGELLAGQDKFTWVRDSNMNYTYRANYSNFGPIEVPAGHCFVMGDNRPHSADSRFWGFVPEDHIVGIGSWIALPPWRWRILK